jgi:hypothetical protein
VTPYINQLGNKSGAIRLHSCGNADHIIDAICEIDHLKIIDTGSNTSLAAIRERMGKDFEINVFPPVDALTNGSDPEKIKQWLSRTLKDNNGGNLKIEYHMEPDYNWEYCLYIHDELDRLGLANKGRIY